MKSLKLLAGFLFVFCFTLNIFANEIIERKNYTVQIKQYDSQYPVAAYIIYKGDIPVLDEVKKTLRKELLIMSKKQGAKNNIIASAWADNKATGKPEKIELSKNYSSFVWVSGKQRTIMTFTDYVNYLKKKKKKAAAAKKL